MHLNPGSRLKNEKMATVDGCAHPLNANFCVDKFFHVKGIDLNLSSNVYKNVQIYFGILL
jgi:hypothetical protein